jgi:hypothetical protein
VGSTLPLKPIHQDAAVHQENCDSGRQHLKKTNIRIIKRTAALLDIA